MNSTIRKIEKYLTSDFSVDNYTNLVKEIFPSISIIAPDIFNDERSNYSSHILGSIHVGTYRSPDNKTITIHAVKLKKESYVENSRSTQRSYAKKLIETGNADAAIIAFYTEGEQKWRLSFVRLDYEIKIKDGRLKATESITPAKRYSYLVGAEEPCHTAISRFYRFITDDSNTIEPTLEDLEDAFSVEKVTEEFFDLYVEKFYQLCKELEKNKDFVIESKQHNFTTAQFAKKLMGQIVFLYFLQKKGWLGVPAWPLTINEKQYKDASNKKGNISRELIPKLYIKERNDKYKLNEEYLFSLSDENERVLAECVQGRPWGTGSKKFMRKLFDYSQRDGGNFFDDYLEPLFYKALNVNRGPQGYDSALHCRIPFLSGGLFEPIDGYDWEHNDFAIPNEVFSNVDEKGDRDADGILDIFDRYNFTMSEDEPLEREVAIDPEMLGKVFENLLEVEDRKTKGAFYTPRSIVHYMCQETLISYLIKKTGLNEVDIRDFVLMGDYMKDVDTSRKNRQKNESLLISENIFKLDKNDNIIVNKLEDIDNALADVRIVDPAVGSGAFPLGMLNEIVRARQNISAYMAITMKPYDIRWMYNNERSPYNLKKETIKNCIFGADIEPSAVDIAQLRLWLSLVIDDEINPNAKSIVDGHRDPIPLPNLECNIVCGDSLIDEFEGRELINQSDIISSNNENNQVNIFTNSFEAILPDLIEAQNEYYGCKDTNEKYELKNKIEELKDELVRIQLDGETDELWNRYLEARRKASRPFVLWQIEFARVFKEKGGFDIVIGNPPYVDSEGMTKKMPEKRELYSQKYKCAKGNWDLYIPFWEKSFNIANESGRVALITSNKWLAIKYGEALRAFLFDYIYNISDYTKFFAFSSADVSTVVVMVQKQRINNIRVIKFRPDFSIQKVSNIRKDIIKPFDNLSLCLSSQLNILYKILDNKSLEDDFDVSGAATVSETYDIAQIVEDIENPDLNKYFKFINTGIIDKFNTRWGLSEMTYVKKKYKNPVVSKSKLNEMFPRRFKQASMEKLITTGIRYFKVFGDFKGEFLAAKSTEVITAKGDIPLKALLPLLNSSVIFFFLKEAYGGIALGGGITFSPNNLSKIPIPRLDKESVSKLIDFANSYSEGFGEAEQDELDIFVYNLFELDESEIKIIELFKQNLSKRNKK